MIDFVEILEARKRIKDIVLETPLEYSNKLSEMLDSDIYFKLENTQITGSFKIRGASNKIMTLSEEEKKRGVITASSGNHAQGLAYAAKKLGIDAKIVISKNASQTKIENTKRLGATVVLAGNDYDESEEYSFILRDEEKRTYVSAFNDPQIIAGQGTIALEIFDKQPNLDILIVPAGGGGLITGIARAAKTMKPDIKIIAVQPELSSPWYEAFKRKKYTKVKISNTWADGLAGDISSNMVDDFNKLVDDVILLSEEEIKKGIFWYITNHNQIAEGASVVGISAMLNKKIDVKGKKVATIITGRNIDIEKLKMILDEYI